MNILLHLATFADIESDIKSFSTNMVIIASALLILSLVVAAKLKNKYEFVKLPLFLAIVAITIIPTVGLLGTTVYLNVVSDSGGPVHWHTDFEVWACDVELELRDPVGMLSNKIGSSTFHEHDDKRLHLEGVVVDNSYDASLEKFFNVIGGNINNYEMVFPVNENPFPEETVGNQVTGNPAHIDSFIGQDENGKKVVRVDNTMSCGDVPAELQVFLIRYIDEDNTYYQVKLDDPARYTMRDESVVPPGDCLVIEFAPFRDRTDKLCMQYGVRDVNKCEQFTGRERVESFCSLREVPAPTNTRSNGGQF